MASAATFPVWCPMAVLIVLLFGAYDADNYNVTCPQNCTCSTTEHLNCTLISNVPVFSDRSSVRSLTITFNKSKTSLTKEDFANFTNLVSLKITRSYLSAIANDTFDEMKGTVVMIHLVDIGLSEIPVGLFWDFQNLNELNFNVNNITVVENSTFVNLPKLITLKIASNNLTRIEVDAFKNVPLLENLVLYSNQLQEIPYIALKPLNKLVHLELGVNQIKSFPQIGDSAMFDSLEDLTLDSNPLKLQNDYMPKISHKIEYLDIAFANIDTFSEVTWVNNKALRTLRLGGNLVPMLHKGMFGNLDNLKNLYLNKMSNLESIGPDAFNGLLSVKLIDVSQNSKLMSIDVGAFISVKLRYLYINNNSLETLQENLLPWKDLDEVLIDHNKFVCDCNLKWIFGAFNPDSKVKTIFDDLTCALPKPLASKKLKILGPGDFVCSTFDHKSRVATGIIAAIVCCVFVVTSFAVFRNRKRIVSRCRRYYQYRRYNNEAIFTVDHDTSVAELEDGDLRPLKEIRLETVPM